MNRSPSIRTSQLLHAPAIVFNCELQSETVQVTVHLWVNMWFNYMQAKSVLWKFSICVRLPIWVWTFPGHEHIATLKSRWVGETQPTIKAGCFSKKKFEIYILAAPLNWKIADLALKGRLADVLLQSLLSTISGWSDPGQIPLKSLRQPIQSLEKNYLYVRSSDLKEYHHSMSNGG